MGLLKDLYRGENRIDFPKWWPRLLVVSAVLVVVSVGSLAFRGLNLGIDFEGGTVYEVTSDASVADAREVLEDAGYEEARIQTVDGGRLRVQTGIEDPQEAARLGTLLTEELGPVESLEQVGPTWGDEVTERARNALVWFFVILTVYIAVRLEWRMAIGALVAVFHDIVVSVGVYSVFQLEVSPGTVVAFLTIMGYSLYDTVIVYDKAKMIEGRLGATGKYTYTEMMNLAMNRVFMRSVNATITSMLPVVSILVVGSYILGASTLREFGWALFVGLIVGAYSSLTIAAVTVIALKEREPRYREIRERLVARGVTGPRMIEREDALLGAGAAAARSARGGVHRERPAAGAPATDGPVEDRPPTAPSPSGAIPPRPRKKKR